MTAWTERQVANARRIEAVRLELHLPSRAGRMATAVALVESNCLRLASRAVPASLAVDWADGVSAGDHDSVGVMQQRAAWGSVLARMACSSSARMFFLGGAGGQRGLVDFPDWESAEFGRACQRVQVSAFPDRYGAAEDRAHDLRVLLASR